jgi:hypothetical protein
MRDAGHPDGTARAIRCVAALLLCVFILHADSKLDSEAVIRQAAAALTSRNAAALWLLFDPAMPGYANFRKESEALLRDVEVESNVDFTKNEGSDTARAMELDWRMQITQRQRAISTTQRHAAVKCQLVKKNGAWRIVSFTPADFFAPTHAEQVWDQLSEAAISLSPPADDRQPVSPSSFLATFDSKMPGYQQLVQDITALTLLGPIESSVELITNDGDDHARSVEVEWTLHVLNRDTSIGQLHRDQRLKLHLEWQGKHWRVTSIDHPEFFRP